MARTPKDVTDAELSVLHALWARGPSSMRTIVDELYPGGGNSEYATVQKLCERLQNKRFVARDRRRRPHEYRATVERDELVGRRMKSVADNLCAGSYTPLINHLLEDGALSSSELRHLRDMVERVDAEEEKRREGESRG